MDALDKMNREMLKMAYRVVEDVDRIWQMLIRYRMTAKKMGEASPEYHSLIAQKKASTAWRAVTQLAIKLDDLLGA